MNKNIKRILAVFLLFSLLYSVWINVKSNFIELKPIEKNVITQNDVTTFSVELKQNTKTYNINHAFFSDSFTINEKTGDNFAVKYFVEPTTFNSSELEANYYDENHKLIDHLYINFKDKNDNNLVGLLMKKLNSTYGVSFYKNQVWYTASKAIYTFKEKLPNNHFYQAIIYNDDVILGKPLNTINLAVTKLKNNESLFAISENYAYQACEMASPIEKVSYKQRHGDGDNMYDHYHPMINNKQQGKGHCWFVD